jgi:hypothetical protein
VSFDFLYNFYLKHFSFWEEFSEILSQTWKRPHRKYPLFLSGFTETWIFSTDFRGGGGPLNITFHQNPSGRSWAVPRGLTGRQAGGHEAGSRCSQYLNAPKNGRLLWRTPLFVAKLVHNENTPLHGIACYKYGSGLRLQNKCDAPTTPSRSLEGPRFFHLSFINRYQSATEALWKQMSEWYYLILYCLLQDSNMAE